MATTTTVHAQLIRYTTTGDQVVVNLKSDGSDISIDRSTNTKLPTSVTSAQALADALGSLAFKNSLSKGDVGLGNVDNTADSAKSVKYATSAGSAGSATKATQDSAGQAINSTYIKSLSATGRTITITKGDGTTDTITTQDTNTTYGVFAKATADAAGGTGLVPAPAKGQQGLYLRGDGSWATPTNTVYTHPNSGVTAGTYKSVTVNAQGHVTGGSNPTTLAGYGITDAAKSGHKHVAADITDNIPASKISGVLSLSNIPAGALERLIPVADDTARFKLTKDNAQNGDVIKVTSTGQMYFIKDETKLSTEDGYEVFAAGTAAAVAWANVTGRPSSMPASDVHPWAKAASKPSYSKSEVGLSNVDNTADANKSVKYATSAGSAGSVAWANVSGKPATYPPSTHTHNYAGSSSAGGAANSANKLSAARTVTGGTDITLSFNYDGSGNSNANIGYYSSSASVGDSNNYPFHRFAKVGPIADSYRDNATTFFISQDYCGGGFGIIRIVLRTNNSTSVSTVDVNWLVRCGLSADSVQVGIYNVFGKTYADAFFKTGGSYAGTYFRAIASGSRGGATRTWILVNSSEASGTSASDAKTSTECYATIAAAGTALHSQAYTGIVPGSDGGTASYANRAGSVSWGNVSGRPSSMPASDVYAWAKATNKPSYSKGEVGLGNVDNTADSAKSVKYATSAGSAGSVAWANVSGKPTSMPASDVAAWAKAASKPTYTKAEVGLGNVDNTADSAKSVKYATSAGSANAVAWGNVTGKPSTFAPSTHSHSNATSSASGFMSNTDKAKLDFGDVIYVSKTAPTQACMWIKLD